MKLIKNFYNCSLYQAKSKIFLLQFGNNYDLCMTFLRYQETYESASDDFRNKKFTIIEYMDWYSKTYGNGVFTYTKDWSGFNIPSDIIEFCFDGGIKDRNKYDDIMCLVYNNCMDLTKDKNFYLIGTNNTNSALEHEIAHGFFYTSKRYNKKATSLFNKLPQDIKEYITKVLSKMGYSSNVHIDESQAYLATGFSKEFDVIKLQKYTKCFIELFKEANEKNKLE